MDNNSLVLVIYNGEKIAVTPQVAEFMLQDCRSLLAQQKKKKRYLANIDLADGAIEDLMLHQPAGFEDALMQKIEEQNLRRAIATLPEVQKRRLIAYFFEGLNYQQIARLEGVNINAVYKSVNLAIEALRKNFNFRV